MNGLRDRHGRRVELLFRDGGRELAAGERLLSAALRLRRELASRAPGRTGAELCRAGLRRLLGMAPGEAEARLPGGAFRLAVPDDLGAFIYDIWCIVLRDQYGAAGAVRGRVVADCGANLGVFSLYAISQGAARVWAFEPVRETFGLLERNLALNGCPAAIKAGCAALGAAPGTAMIKYNTRGEGSAMIGGEDTINAGIHYAGRRRVRLRPLDSLLKGRLDFIKIDTEGSEAAVLAGAARLIRRWRPAISMAAYHREGDPQTLPAVLRSIAPGYRVSLRDYGERDLFCAPR